MSQNLITARHLNLKIIPNIYIHQTQVRYLNLSRYQSIRPPLTEDQGGLLLGIGGGGRIVS
jgi:hypothetical protein